jgi:hypothetical protein
MAIVAVLKWPLVVVAVVVVVVVAYSTGNTVVTNRYPAIAVVTFSPGIGTSRTLLLLPPPLLRVLVVVEDGFIISSLDDDFIFCDFLFLFPFVSAFLLFILWLL